MSATNRVYPSDVVTWYADKASVAEGDVVRGVNIGAEEPNGVGSPEDFADYTPIHMIENPSDGINNGAKYVVYFQKLVDDEIKLFKATNADPATLTELVLGTVEHDLALSKQQN